MPKKRVNDAFNEPQIVRSYSDKLYRASIHKPNGDQLLISPGFKRVDTVDEAVAESVRWFARYIKRHGVPAEKAPRKAKAPPAPTPTGADQP